MADNNQSSENRVSLGSRVSKKPTHPPVKKSSGGTVNISQRTAKKAPKKQGGKKKKAPVGKIVMWSLIALLIVLCFVLFMVALPLLQDLFGEDDNSVDVPDDAVIGFTQTPSAISGKVNYYLVGLFGDDLSDQMQSLALVCHDKAADEVNVLQIPTSTLLSDSGHWAVKKIGNVWANPKDLNWCPECKKEVFDPEIEEGKHTVCNTTMSTQKGSSHVNLMQALNYDYSMPIDNYYLFQQGSLKETVDFLGGLDIKLESAVTLGEVDYPAGVQTLDGQAIVEYMKYDGTSVSGEVAHEIDRRAVWVALFQKLAAMDVDAMYDDVLSKVMNWDNPIKTSRISNYWETDIKNMCKLIREIGKIPSEKFTFYMLPGEAATSAGVVYYSPHKADVAKLLQEKFNPYGDPIDEEDLTLEEIAHTTDSDTKAETFDTLEVVKETEESEDAA